MMRRPPISTRTDTLFPYTTLFRAERLEYRVAEPELRRDRVLLAGDPRLAPLLLVAEAQHLFGGVEQFGQQLPFPAVPHAGTDRADIDDGENEQQPQPLGALPDLREIEERLEIGTEIGKASCRERVCQ